MVSPIVLVTTLDLSFVTPTTPCILTSPILHPMVSMVSRSTPDGLLASTIIVTRLTAPPPNGWIRHHRGRTRVISTRCWRSRSLTLSVISLVSIAMATCFIRPIFARPTLNLSPSTVSRASFQSSRLGLRFRCRSLFALSIGP